MAITEILREEIPADWPYDKALAWVRRMMGELGPGGDGLGVAIVLMEMLEEHVEKHNLVVIDPRLIHDAVLPEVVGDYEAAEA